MVILHKLSNLFDPSVLAEYTTYKPPIVSINANKALVSRFLLNTEPLFPVILELSLEIELIMLFVFGQLSVPMKPALIELALELVIRA